ncbi:hypothetical protein CASFOL_036356 [Castilleja foliolosa]
MTTVKGREVAFADIAARGFLERQELCHRHFQHFVTLVPQWRLRFLNEINELSTWEECKEHVEETSDYSIDKNLRDIITELLKEQSVQVAKLIAFMEGVVERTRNKSTNEDNQDDGQEEDEDHGQDHDPEDSDYSSKPTI